MKTYSTVISIMALTATLAAVPASAQSGSGTITTAQLDALAGDLGSVLRFRQLGDTATVARGRFDIGVQFGSAPVEDPADSWNVTRFGARFGVSDRVDIGVWGGNNSRMKAGMFGVDTKILLVSQGPDIPVSISLRPSFSSLAGSSEAYAANVGVDLSVSRTFGALSPYGGIAAMSSIASERLQDITVERGTAGQTLAFAGLAYSWRSLVGAVEIEKGTKVSYAFRLGARF